MELEIIHYIYKKDWFFNYNFLANLHCILNLQLHSKETGALGSSSYEQGSSWAVEVGSHMKVCPIIVENLNMDGQMVVEVCTGLLH